MKGPRSEKVTRDDLEAKLRQIGGEAKEQSEAVKDTGVIVGVLAAAAVIAVVYLLGRKRGRRRSTVVEIRRV